MEEYRVSELDGVVVLNVSVLNGSIGTNILLKVTLNGGSAMCKL